MYEERLPAHLWIQAHLRTCSAEGIPATVMHKGERMSGMLLLKLGQFPQLPRSDADARYGRKTRLDARP